MFEYLGHRSVANYEQVDGGTLGLQNPDRVEKMRDPFLFDEASDKQQIGTVPRWRPIAIFFGLYAVTNDFKLRRRKIAGEQRLADVLGNADDQGRLSLLRLAAPLEDRRNQLPPVVGVFGRVAAVESDHQREPQGARKWQGKGAAASEMGVDHPRPQRCEIWRGRNTAELLEH